MKKWSEMFSHQEKAQKQILNNKMRNKNFLRQDRIINRGNKKLSRHK